MLSFIQKSTLREALRRKPDEKEISWRIHGTPARIDPPEKRFSPPRGGGGYRAPPGPPTKPACRAR